MQQRSSRRGRPPFWRISRPRIGTTSLPPWRRSKTARHVPSCLVRSPMATTRYRPHITNCSPHCRTCISMSIPRRCAITTIESSVRREFAEHIWAHTADLPRRVGSLPAHRRGVHLRGLRSGCGARLLRPSGNVHAARGRAGSEHPRRPDRHAAQSPDHGHRCCCPTPNQPVRRVGLSPLWITRLIGA